MERSEHLKFCKVCINRRMNSSKGLICCLTGDIADFEDECPDFVLDEQEQKSLETRFKNKDVGYHPDALPVYNVPKKRLSRLSNWIFAMSFLYLLCTGVLEARQYAWIFFVISLILGALFPKKPMLYAVSLQVIFLLGFLLPIFDSGYQSIIGFLTRGFTVFVFLFMIYELSTYRTFKPNKSNSEANNSD